MRATRRVRPGPWLGALFCAAFLLLLGARYKEADIAARLDRRDQ